VHVDRTVPKDFCQTAEDLGYGSLWAQEHLFFPHEVASPYAGQAGRPVPREYQTMLAATETMMAAAAWTDRVTIGSSILVAGYHRPVELAQRLTTIDVLSQGRLIAGFSVGWSDEEHAQMDVDPRTRGRRCDELIDALTACWGPDPVAFEGEFFSIPRSDVSPKPVQQPRPRLLSGMLSAAGRRRTAKKFDIWNPVGDAAQIRADVDEMNGDRPAGMAPLEVYQRLFLERPGGESEPNGVDGVIRLVERARQFGMDAVIIDASFWRGIDSPRAWLELPEQLRATLDAG
jgi:probable F420-dependent oxidoreductase